MSPESLAWAMGPVDDNLIEQREDLIAKLYHEVLVYKAALEQACAELVENRTQPTADDLEFLREMHVRWD